MNGNTWQLRADGCNITLLVAGAETYYEDYAQEGDEITVVIKGQMTNNGWKVIQIFDYTEHDEVFDCDDFDDEFEYFDDCDEF